MVWPLPSCFVLCDSGDPGRHLEMLHWRLNSQGSHGSGSRHEFHGRLISIESNKAIKTGPSDSRNLTNLCLGRRELKSRKPTSEECEIPHEGEMSRVYALLRRLLTVAHEVRQEYIVQKPSEGLPAGLIEFRYFVLN